MKKNNGITLVALVITIIILLILAGITIAQLTGSGLFENARLAQEKSQNAQEQEDETLADYENKIEGYLDASRNTSSYSITKLGEATGNTPISIDATKYDELYILIAIEGDSDNLIPIEIKTIALKDTPVYFYATAAWSKGLYSAAAASKTEISLSVFQRDGNDRTSLCAITVYGIKY